jgi:hypothetical protein
MHLDLVFERDMRSQFATETAPPKLITVVRKKVLRNLETIVEENDEMDIKVSKSSIFSSISRRAFTPLLGAKASRV